MATTTPRSQCDRRSCGSLLGAILEFGVVCVLVFAGTLAIVLGGRSATTDPSGLYDMIAVLSAAVTGGVVGTVIGAVGRHGDTSRHATTPTTRPMMMIKIRPHRDILQQTSPLVTAHRRYSGHPGFTISVNRAGKADFLKVDPLREGDDFEGGQQ